MKTSDEFTNGLEDGLKLGYKQGRKDAIDEIIKQVNIKFHVVINRGKNKRIQISLPKWEKIAKEMKE